MGCGASAPAPVQSGELPVVERSLADGDETNGLLPAEQEQAVRENVDLASDGLALESLATATVESERQEDEDDTAPKAAPDAPPPPVPAMHTVATNPAAPAPSAVGRPQPCPCDGAVAVKRGGRLEAAHLAYVLAATGGKGTAREGSPSVIEVYQALKGVYGRSTPQGPGAPPRRDDRADGSRLWMTEAQVEGSTAVEDYSTWNREAERARRLHKLAEIRELTWDLLRAASERSSLNARFAMAEPQPEPEPAPAPEPVQPEPEPKVLCELDAEELGISQEFLAQLQEVFNRCASCPMTAPLLPPPPPSLCHNHSAVFGVNANGLSRVDQNRDGSLTRIELIKRLRKDEELVSLLDLPKHLSDGDRSAFEAVFQGCDISTVP